jgi:2'-5' RNA ligase
VEPSNVHITLKFLGNITHEQLDKVIVATREVLRFFEPFGVSISGLGTFPGKTSPRVIWIGIVEGKQELARLSKAIDKSLSKAGFPHERREFSPHLTLGRVKSSERRDGLTKAIASTDASNLGSMRVEKIAIMRSQLTPLGPIYTALEAVELISNR